MGYPDWPARSTVVEGQRAFSRAINKLVDEDHVTRVNVLPERTTGSRDDHVGAPLLVQCIDVGPVVDLGGRRIVSPSVSVCVDSVSWS